MQRGLLLLILNVSVMFLLMSVLGLRVNISDSYPLGVYKRTGGDYSLMSLVESCLPESVARFMVARDYIPSKGKCEGYPPVIKTIYAVSGDAVAISTSVSVNGVRLPNTELLLADSVSRPLAPAKDTVIEDNHVWLMSMNALNSYDARYFGQTPSALIISNLKPLWTAE